MAQRSRDISPGLAVVGADPAMPVVSSAPAPARPPRSKKTRPCDRCRHRKSRCAIARLGEPCSECAQTGNPCTFDLPPPARPKKEAISEPSYLDAPPQPLPDPPSQPASLSVEPGSSLHRAKRPRYETTPTREPNEPVAFSLDDLPSDTEPSTRTATLTDDLLTHNTIGPPQKMVSSQSHTTFITLSRRPHYRPPTVDSEIALLSQIRPYLKYATCDCSESVYLNHYFAFAFPTFPVLAISAGTTALEAFRTYGPGLQALVLGEAAAHYPGYYNFGCEVRDKVKTAKIADRMLDARAKLSSISAALLEININRDPRGEFLLLSKTIAHAQLLGLHIDCSGWAIPEREKALRTRLWWALRTQDAWSSFLNSRPSHIQPNNTSVRLPPFPEDDTITDSYQGGIAFGCSIRLGVIVARLQAEVSTLDRADSPLRIESCDSAEDDLAKMKGGLQFWYAKIATRTPGMDAVLFLVLALRCMVRRIGIELRFGLGSPFDPDQSTLSIFDDLVNLVERLSTTTFDANQIFPGYSSHVLSSVLSSLIRLSLAQTASNAATTSPADPAQPSPLNMLFRLRQALERLSSHHKFRIVDSAIQRAESVSVRLEQAMQSDDLGFDPVISALRGHEPEPPATNDADLFGSLAALASQSHRVGLSVVSAENLGDLDQWLREGAGIANASEESGYEHSDMPFDWSMFP
ncbi:Dal81p [Sporobolomyces koalae]|uniref:Dal81p n=1 Tax=Sporobolomyces koalae TaxID=500713 RepID=UPI0031812AC6